MTKTITYGDVQYTISSEIPHNDDGLIKIRLDDGDGVEGIWAWIHPDDKADYDNNVHDEDYHRLCVLANRSLAGIPWGTYVPYRLDGSMRPECLCWKVINRETDSPVLSEDAKKAYNDEPPL